MGESGIAVSQAITEAISTIRNFGSVAEIVGIETGSNTVQVRCTWKVSLPNKYKQAGVSEKGVRELEDVCWAIPANYPVYAPTPLLRPGFPTHFPHINPHKEGDFVPPCISEIPLTDLLHSQGQGLTALLDALNQWLMNAAANELHCPTQGWEPMRRDQAHGMILADAQSIRQILESKYATFRYFDFRYYYHSDKKSSLVGTFNTPPLGSSNDSYTTSRVEIDKFTGIRSSPGALFQTSKTQIIDKYQADTVTNLGELKRFAHSIGLLDALKARLRHIASLFKPNPHCPNQKAPEEFVIVFAVQRPFNIIGTSNPYELIPYRVLFTPGKSGTLSDTTAVYPTWLMDKCTPSLLQAVSGTSSYKKQHISLIGCGSLGSKLALHLAKSGAYEFDLVDNDYFSSHNNARHGIISPNFSNLLGNKAMLLENEIKCLGISAKARNFDIRNLGVPKKNKLSRNTNWIIDSTASLAVRHYLSHNFISLPARLIYTLMYGKASLGVIAMEGAQRSPKVDDLAAYLNTLCIDSTSIRASMYTFQNPTQQMFGEGCSSATTLIADTKLSFMTSAITSKINRIISNKQTSKHGLLNVASIDENSLELFWEHHEIAPTFIIPADNKFPWHIRLVGNVAEKIHQQSKAFPGKENGGILSGTICNFSKTLYITRLFDAPESSIRTESTFKLSIDGLDSMFYEIHKRAHGKIAFLGTWHSHTQPTPPSIIDKNTLHRLQNNSHLPIVMLVYTNGKIVRVTT